MLALVLACSRSGNGDDDDSAAPVEDAGIRSLTGLPEGDAPCDEPLLVEVIHVSDGDTVRVREDGGTAELDVRFIGIDTPEIAHDDPAECYGDEAHAATEAALDGQLLWLTFDAECLDQYGRTLAYVFLGNGDDDFFNRWLARYGYAYQLTIEPNDTFAADIRADVSEAREAGRGVWGECE